MLSTRKKAVFALIAIFAGTAAGFILGEVALRIHPPDWLVQRMNDLNLRENAEEFGSDAGWSVERIDGKFVQFTPMTHFDIKYVEYHNHADIDRWGGRVVKGNDAKDGGFVPFLGDSFMFGIGVEGEQTFVSLLSRQTPLRYLNLGVPGSALPNHLDMLEVRFRELHSPPVCVFSFFTGNDYTDIIKYYTERRGNNGGLDQRDQPWLLKSINSAIAHFHFLGRSYLVECCKQLLINRALRTTQTSSLKRAWSIATPSGRHLANAVILLMDRRQLFREEAVTYLDRALSRLTGLSHEYGFTPVFVVIPEKHQVDADLLSEKLDEFQLDRDRFDPELPSQIVDEELRKYGVRYFDLLDCLKGKKGQYYKIDDHFTPAGCATAAQCLTPALNTTIASLMKGGH